MLTYKVSALILSVITLDSDSLLYLLYYLKYYVGQTDTVIGLSCLRKGEPRCLC
jgi:hypothetical protein